MKQFLKGVMVCDHTIFRTLYLVYFFCLRFNRHILVNDADAALPGHRDSHTVFRNGIHPGAHHRNIQLYCLCQHRRQIHLIWYHF